MKLDKVYKEDGEMSKDDYEKEHLIASASGTHSSREWNRCINNQ